MRYRLMAPALWPALRHGLARLGALVAETGNSDEDLVFRIRKFEPEDLLPDRTGEPRMVAGCEPQFSPRHAGREP
jgi:hypothetical protein